MKNLKQYIQENRDRFIDELFEILKIPSISADPKYKEDVLKCAELVKNKLIISGAENVKLCQTDGYPIVYADKIIDKNGVKIMGETNILNKLPVSASSLYAKNVFNFVSNLYDNKNKKININLEDEIITKTLIK